MAKKMVGRNSGKATNTGAIPLPAELRVEVYGYLLASSTKAQHLNLRLVSRTTKDEFDYETIKREREYRKNLQTELSSYVDFYTIGNFQLVETPMNTFRDTHCLTLRFTHAPPLRHLPTHTTLMIYALYHGNWTLRDALIHRVSELNVEMVVPSSFLANHRFRSRRGRHNRHHRKRSQIKKLLNQELEKGKRYISDDDMPGDVQFTDVTPAKFAATRDFWVTLTFYGL